MERKDKPLLDKIDAIAKLNDQKIEQIKNKQSSDVKIAYKYTFTTKKTVTVSARNHIPTGDTFEITELPVTNTASSILSYWCPEKDLHRINDYFNDNLDYTCNKFADIERLNKDMVRVAKKFVIFDCTQTSLDVIQSFLQNMEILQEFLEEIEDSFKDAPRRYDEVIKQVNALNKALNGVTISVVEVNEDEQKIQQKRNEKQQAQQERFSLREKYKGCTLKEAKEKKSSSRKGSSRKSSSRKGSSRKGSSRKGRSRKGSRKGRPKGNITQQSCSQCSFMVGRKNISVDL